MNHMMSPTGVAVLILLALVVDYLSIGPDSIRDRIAFLIALPAIREGFNGGPLDQWTVGALSQGIAILLHTTGGAYIAGATVSVVLSAAVGILAIYAVGALLPVKLNKRLGRFAQLTFPTSAIYRMNWKLWLCAALLGMMADLPQGIVGTILRAVIDGLTSYVAILPNLLFGVS